MTSAEPLLTADVVIPCWGSYSRHLERCVRSVTGARRVVVVGDAQACRLAVGLGAEAIRLSGDFDVAMARQAGFSASTADAVCFLDADDTFKPGALVDLRRMLADAPEAVAVSGLLERVHAEGVWPPPRLARAVCGPLGGPLLLFANGLCVVGACLLRRDAFADVLLFPSLADEDWHAAVVVRARGRVLFLDRAVVDYDTSPGSLSRHARPFDDYARSHDRLIRTALAGGAAPKLAWQALEIVARPYRTRKARDRVARWSDRQLRT